MAAFSSRRLSRDCDACLAALIDKTCKNSWKWEWLERMTCGTVACGAFIQKIAQPGKAVCTWCSKEIVYGGRGYKSLESHAESKKHRDIQRIRASNYSLPGCRTDPKQNSRREYKRCTPKVELQPEMKKQEQSSCIEPSIKMTYENIPPSSKEDKGTSQIIELKKEKQDPESMQESGIEGTQDIDGVDPESFNPSTPQGSIPSNFSSAGKRRKRDQDSVTGKVFQYSSAQSKAQEKTKQEEPHDADKQFLLALYPLFQDLDPCAKSLLKIKIQQLVHEARFPPVELTNH